MTAPTPEHREALAEVLERARHGLRLGDPRSVAEQYAEVVLASPVLADMLATAWDAGWNQGAWDVEENGWEPHDLLKGRHPANPYRAAIEAGKQMGVRTVAGLMYVGTCPKDPSRWHLVPYSVSSSSSAKVDVEFEVKPDDAVIHSCDNDFYGWIR